MRKLVTALVLGTTALLAASTSCATFDYPDGSCKGARVVTNASAVPDCASCVEQHCCDAVGRCEDRGDSCLTPVRDMFDCVLQKEAVGASSGGVEKECVNALAGDVQAKATYACMRDQCGDACRLPSCRVDTGAGLIASAQCDACFSGSCCSELNACYRNRACKLITECITSRCASSLSPAMEIAASFGLGNVDLTTDEVCTRNAAPYEDAAIPGASVPAMECVFTCIREFGANDQAGALDPPSGAYCLSTKIFLCGIRSGCAAKCAIPDAGTDAGPTATDASDASDADIDAD